MTPQDQKGGGYLRMCQVKGSAWVPGLDLVRGYHDEVMALVQEPNTR